MNPENALREISAGAVPLDLRPPARFAAGHVGGAVALQFNRADLAERAELYLPTEERYVLFADNDVIARTAEEILHHAGFDIAGYVEGGVAAWSDADLPTQVLSSISIDDVGDPSLKIVDVREPFEYDFAHIAGALLHPSTQSWYLHDQLPAKVRLAFVCADEVRSAYVASLALRQGKDARLVLGGMSEWINRSLPTEGNRVAIAN
ncbi:MAG TPA: rhodanese-like domain-containing protein [Actinomycetota bacterium]|nr:rhodanese-like domain-containing protein [Actinomycetota bacterium]